MEIRCRDGGNCVEVHLIIVIGDQLVLGTPPLGGQSSSVQAAQWGSRFSVPRASQVSGDSTSTEMLLGRVLLQVEVGLETFRGPFPTILLWSVDSFPQTVKSRELFPCCPFLTYIAEVVWGSMKTVTPASAFCLYHIFPSFAGVLVRRYQKTFAFLK